MDDIKKLIQELTVEEKAELCSGADFWHTKVVERLNLPSVRLSDGPHGVRKQENKGSEYGQGQSVEAVCFPAASALACSFDRELMTTLGKTLGEECQAEDVNVLLGPGINIKRSPLCGRNFEYFSEDPYLAGELSASYINGVQSMGIGTSLKHFAVNNQEHRRMSISAEVDDRTLREIYLTNYEIAVKKSQPWTVMCSYNRINGTYSCENDWLLNQVLRKEWGFQGLVMTDWGAMNDRTAALMSGLDLEMPSSHGENDKKIIEAVKSGRISMGVLDAAVKNVLNLIKKSHESKFNRDSYNMEEHHLVAKKASEECAVLLKNDGILPLKKGTKVAFIGDFAKNPRYQGSGSSHVNSFKVTNAFDAAQEIGNITFAQGYDSEDDTKSGELLNEAISAAKASEITVIFAGLPDSFESEGFDRKHLELPAGQNRLIEEISQVQPNTVVVLHNGSPILLPWESKVKGILEMYLGGQAIGEAEVSILFGDVNPSGKLAESFPKRLQDTPCYLSFPGSEKEVKYSEGIFVGYRYYDAKEIETMYPFGYGLSYTTFQYSELSVNSENIKDTDTIEVKVKVKNTGKVFGKEIVQLYVHDVKSKEVRPVKELKGFEKVSLNPGEEVICSFTLDKRAFAYYETQIKDWFVESGEFEIMIGKSSRDIVVSKIINIESTQKLPFTAGDTTTIGDVYQYAKDPSVIDELMKKCNLFNASDENNGALGAATMQMMRQMLDEMPLHSLLSFSHNDLTLEEVQSVISGLNKQ